MVNITYVLTTASKLGLVLLIYAYAIHNLKKKSKTFLSCVAINFNNTWQYIRSFGFYLVWLLHKQQNSALKSSRSSICAIYLIEIWVARIRTDCNHPHPVNNEYIVLWNDRICNATVMLIFDMVMFDLNMCLKISVSVR